MSSNLKESSSIASIIQSRRQACLVVEQNINERRRGTFGQKVLAVHEITAILYYNIYIYIYIINVSAAFHLHGVGRHLLIRLC